jgi:hypothetical protein
VILIQHDIFPDTGLKELCRKLPLSEKELTSEYIFGVSERLLNRYGREFLGEIGKFVKENKIKKDEKEFENFTSGHNGTSKKVKSRMFDSIRKSQDSCFNLLNQSETKPRALDIFEDLDKIVDVQPNENDLNLSGMMNRNDFEDINYLENSNIFENEPEEVGISADTAFLKDIKQMNKKRRDEDDENEEKQKKVNPKAEYFKKRAMFKKFNKYKKK